MKNDEKERKKQEKMMIKSGKKLETWWKRETKPGNMMKNRETTIKNDEKQRKNNETF